MKGWQKKHQELPVQTTGQVLNCLNKALAFISRGHSFVGQKRARRLILEAIATVEFERFKNTHSVGED